VPDRLDPCLTASLIAAQSERDCLDLEPIGPATQLLGLQADASSAETIIALHVIEVTSAA